MIYKYNGKYYVKVSGYLIEVKPLLKNNKVDFDTTQNKIEITSGVTYKAVNLDEIKEELKRVSINEENDTKPKKLNERTHNKFKFDFKE